MSNLVLRRGDTRTITLTMDTGAGLNAVDGIAFTTRATPECDTTIWVKDQDDMTLADTTAAYTITVADWDAWENAGCPTTMAYDFEVTDGTTVTTQGYGTIKVQWDVSRA